VSLPEDEGGVATTEPERERTFGSTRGIEPSVPNVETFGVNGRNRVAEFYVIVVIKRNRPSDWELSSWITLAKDRICNSGSTFVAAKESLEKSRGLVEPCKLDRHSGLVHNDGIWNSFEDGLDEIIGSSRKFQVVSIVCFGFPFGSGTD
jgi:hypothetical protein